MRWRALFTDLEHEFEAAEQAQHAAEVADRTRRELARLRLVDRLAPAVGASLSIGLRAGEVVSGVVDDVGPDWLLLLDDARREVLVPFAAVTTVRGLGAAASEPGREGQVAARLDLRYALRVLARSRSVVALSLDDGGTLTCTVERVGVDWIDVSESAALRNAAATTRLVPIAAIVVIRSR